MIQLRAFSALPCMSALIVSVVVVVVKKAAGTKFLKVTLPDGVLSQPPVIQFPTFFYLMPCLGLH